MDIKYKGNNVDMDTHEHRDDSLSTTRDRFQILALDGGGVKALFTAHVLARLEEDLGVTIRDHFDLIAGTSAGGIIALALGLGLSPAEIADQFEHLVGDVFPARRRRNPLRVFRAAYSQGPLRRSLIAILGDRCLGDSEKRLLIPAWDVQAGEVHLYKTPHHSDFYRDWRLPMVDVALATSAAPTYFPAARVDGQRLIDGGVWANNPSVVAITEALDYLGRSREEIRVLNIGTTDEVADHPRRLDHAGLVGWARHAATLIITAGSRSTQGIAQHLIEPDHYQRSDVAVPKGTFRLDRANPEDLAGYAASASRKLAPQFQHTFGGHAAEPYQPERIVHNITETSS